MTSGTLNDITSAGVSLWLDDLDRSRLDPGSGERSLQHLIRSCAIRGVTTNPTIFDRAVSSGAAAYAEQLRSLAHRGLDVDEAIRVVTTDDVRSACDILLPIWEASGGVDGRVSIEVDPRLAHDTVATVDQARELWEVVDRPNAMIKIPATLAGLPAITEVIAHGISVNVTLIFSVDRYRQVMAAHEEGLHRAHAAGVDLRSIESVASFFVSRVDTKVDPLLDDLDSPEAAALRGRAAIANAQVAWSAYLDHTQSASWRAMVDNGARPQRPLWASTGVKDPAYDPTRYVVDLVAPGCVNTVPEATLQAVAEHGVFRGDTVSQCGDRGREVIDGLRRLGIDLEEVCDSLEESGVRSFVDSWEALRSTVARTMAD